MKIRPLGKLSDFFVEQMSSLLMEESASPNLGAMTVSSLIDELPKELIDQVCADPALCDIASLDLKMIEQAITHTSGVVPPKNLLALVNKVSGAAKSLPMLSYEELVLVNPKEDLRTFTHGRIGEVEKKFYLSHYTIEQQLGAVLTQLHRVRNGLLGCADTYSDKSINMGEVETNLFASVKTLVDLNTTMDPEDFKSFRKFYMVTDHRGLEGPSGAHSGAIPEIEVLLFWNWLWPSRDKYIISHYGYFPRENRERIRVALRQPSLVQLVEHEGSRHSDIRSLMLAVSKFMVAFSSKHYGAVQRHLPDVLANKAPGTSVAEKSGDFLSAIKDERQQQLNKLIEIFG